MGDKSEPKDEAKPPIKMTPRQPLRDYVCYVVATVSIKVKTRSKEEAAKHAQNEVMERLKRVDNNVYIPRVAVLEADDDDEQKQNIAKAQAPWLMEYDVDPTKAIEFDPSKKPEPE